MGAGCWLVWSWGGFAARPLIGLPVVILLGFIFYGLGCALVRVPELSQALRWLGKLPAILPSIGE
jgi:hypothetical protein